VLLTLVYANVFASGRPVLAFLGKTSWGNISCPAFGRDAELHIKLNPDKVTESPIVGPYPVAVKIATPVELLYDALVIG
jgi:hypothetical protein